MFATVSPEIKTAGNETFTYIVPSDLENLLTVGSVVYMPFGKRQIRGVVTGFEKEIPTKYKLRKITNTDHTFSLPSLYIDIASWISKYYLCSLGEAIALFLPPRIVKPRSRKDPDVSKKPPGERIQLTAEQKVILDKLTENLINPKKHALIHGVTGSGKTEIYIELAKKTLARGRQVIVLVPEIMHTPQIMERFEEAFHDKVALMHSNLSRSEKYHCFSDFYTSRKPIIVGPRSALLVPSPNIGLIIVDEEQEDSFKQEQSPRYHAVDLAEKLADKSNALLVMGSATPRVETYYRAKNGIYDLLTLGARFNNNKLPATKIVDLRDEIKSGNFSLLSRQLEEEINVVLKNKRQALIFLNRRGMATFVSCRDCGHVLLCPNCSIPLIYFVSKNNGHLSCHHCGYKKNMATVCPNCQSARIKYFGAGIDKVAEVFKSRFPNARIVKIDSTTMASKNAYSIFYRQLKDHEIDIVIGTQIIAKGLDIPKVDLVGAVSADTGLHMPHYRASEKTFQIITQVSGRSGRGDTEGKTIIQTYWPESSSILSAAKHDFKSFYNSEIGERMRFVYPPFIHLIRVISENIDEAKALSSIQALASDLLKVGLDFIGPGPCFYHKLLNRFRFHLIIKIKNLPDERIAKLKSQHLGLTFDVDPTDLL